MQRYKKNKKTEAPFGLAIFGSIFEKFYSSIVFRVYFGIFLKKILEYLRVIEFLKYILDYFLNIKKKLNYFLKYLLNYFLKIFIIFKKLTDSNRA